MEIIVKVWKQKLKLIQCQCFKLWYIFFTCIFLGHNCGPVISCALFKYLFFFFLNLVDIFATNSHNIERIVDK